MLKPTTFLRAVYERAKQQTKDFLGGTVRGAILTAVFSLVVSVVRFYVFGRDSAVNYVQEFIADFLLSGGLFLLALFTINLLRAPGLLYNELQIRLDQYEPDLTKITVSAYENFLNQQVGIDIKNLTPEDFTGVIELTDFGCYVVDENCEEQDWSSTLDKGNTHFLSPQVRSYDHQVILLAELKEDRIVFLTENTFFMLTEFFFARPKPIPQPNFVKIYFPVEFEIRGRFKKLSFNRKFETLVTVRLNKKITSTINIGEVTPAAPQRLE